MGSRVSPNVLYRLLPGHCHKCGKGLTAGLAKKKFPYYWCFTKGCKAVFVSAAQLERAFIAPLQMFEPTKEYFQFWLDTFDLSANGSVPQRSHFHCRFTIYIYRIKGQNRYTRPATEIVRSA